jgi:hypothetical protein
MKMNKFTLSNDELEDCVTGIQYSTGFILTHEQIKSILTVFDIDEIRKFGVFDTVVRETLMNNVSKKLLGESWPTYGETRSGEVDWKNFISRLRLSAIDHGWKIADEVN